MKKEMASRSFKMKFRIYGFAKAVLSDLSKRPGHDMFPCGNKYMTGESPQRLITKIITSSLVCQRINATKGAPPGSSSEGLDIEVYVIIPENLHALINFRVSPEVIPGFLICLPLTLIPQKWYF
ncbi:hypothetical protein FW778_14500 [Ginsengibacter hankyongi]|uniref:Uncharacterized protein n=1 Tax=Ginsengibacter hankyongi TaxID=2607284 RepID=A0A5J5IH50_9BACT|nr:hypothetical protein [Ginsengibacter hankyongi]KAA9038751.1 hypothetical protein FW778_14500 [Ginsengibacter hankyongi]